jgi:hypothetical protein
MAAVSPPARTQAFVACTLAACLAIVALGAQGATEVRRIVRTGGTPARMLPPPASGTGHWPSFRGHEASGSADGQRLPATWNPASGANVLWRQSIPGLAHSSPVVWGELADYLRPMWRWIDAIQRDFAARADWSVESYEEANHPPIVKLAHEHDLRAKRGDTVHLSAQGTIDPDGDIVTYRWWQYHEADTYGGQVEIRGTGTSEASLTVPGEAGDGETIHVICEVTDTGEPRLTRYQRIVITVTG